MSLVVLNELGNRANIGQCMRHVYLKVCGKDRCQG